MVHDSKVILKETAKCRSYIYVVDGEVVRTSKRQYKYSTADGKYFSSRLDLLMKNSKRLRELENANRRAELTTEQSKEELKRKLALATADVNYYSDEKKKEDWVKRMTDNILYNYRNKPTEEEVKEQKEDSEFVWENGLEKAKYQVRHYSTILDDENKILQEVKRINEEGLLRVQELEIVEYKHE